MSWRRSEDDERRCGREEAKRKEIRGGEMNGRAGRTDGGVRTVFRYPQIAKPHPPLIFTPRTYDRKASRYKDKLGVDAFKLSK
jgi:hypothetical protein